eukprot:4828661-Amphidinium_carterae.1
MPKLWNDNSGWDVIDGKFIECRTYGMTTWDGLPYTVVASSCQNYGMTTWVESGTQTVMTTKWPI